jgi:hypothetical protein
MLEPQRHCPRNKKWRRASVPSGPVMVAEQEKSDVMGSIRANIVNFHSSVRLHALTTVWRLMLLDCTYTHLRKRTLRSRKFQSNEDLEHRVLQLEGLIKTLTAPCNHEVGNTRGAVDGPDRSRDRQIPSNLRSNKQLSEPVHQDPLIEAMVNATGKISMQDQESWNYHGHASPVAFLERFRQDFGAGIENFEKLQNVCDESLPRLFLREGSLPPSMTQTALLPSKNIALELVDAALDDACSIENFVHRPTFDYHFDCIYNMDPRDYGPQEVRYLPLLYAVLALGCLFWEKQLKESGVNTAIRKGCVLIGDSPNSWLLTETGTST